MSSTRLLLLNCLLHYVQLQDHFYSYDSWKVKILLVGGDVISWITGLLHYNTRQFISLLNICGDMNSWIRVSHGIHELWSPILWAIQQYCGFIIACLKHPMMNPQYCWISRLKFTWTISRLRHFHTKNYSLSANKLQSWGCRWVARQLCMLSHFRYNGWFCRNYNMYGDYNKQFMWLIIWNSVQLYLLIKTEMITMNLKNTKLSC